MDTDPELAIPGIIKVSAASKYSLEELEQIFWNEVYPAVQFNLWLLPAPEWRGFELNWLTQRILAKHRYGKLLPWKIIRRDTNAWWQQLKQGVVQARGR